MRYFIKFLAEGILLTMLIGCGDQAKVLVIKITHGVYFVNIALSMASTCVFISLEPYDSWL